MIDIGDWSLFAIGSMSLLAWLHVLWMERWNLRSRTPMPVGVRDSVIVALLASVTLGAISTLGLTEVMARDLAKTISGLWLGTSLACGVYAVIASLHDDDKQRASRRRDSQ